jgi:hypothetical protein
VQVLSSGTAWPPLSRLFLRIAENVATAPPSAYVNKAFGILDMAVGAACLGLCAAAFWLARATWIAPARRFSLGILRFAAPAALLLGMTVAMRTAGLFAAVLVAAYAWLLVGRRGAAFLLCYGILAGLVTFVLWPQLWGSPFELLQSSVARSLHFPDEHEVLFRGQVFSSNGLPRDFLAVLLGTQLTLPAATLVLVAVPITGWIAIRRVRSETFLWILLAWFLIPCVAVVLFCVPVYNNFRHLLFAVPPVFVMVSLAVERFLQGGRRPAWLLPAASAIVLAPGVVGIVRLHPYEYVYYNELVGGVRGAYGQFELDYWCTSYR